MTTRVQRHASVSKQTTLLDGVDVGPPKWHICGRDLNHSVNEGHLKCKGSFKLLWKSQYMYPYERTVRRMRVDFSLLLNVFSSYILFIIYNYAET